MVDGLQVYNYDLRNDQIRVETKKSFFYNFYWQNDFDSFMFLLKKRQS